MKRITLAMIAIIASISFAHAEIVSHPKGCPKRAFCGCGASVEIFGRPVRDLFLARNWFRFPRTSPAPGTVAVRRHHVFVLKSHVQGSVWMVYDANSGGRKTRMHQRSISGWAIVNPHTTSAKVASRSETAHD